MEAQFEALSELVKNGQKLNFGQDFFVKFYQAFLYSDRWQQYIKGVGTTLLVTAIALVLGVVLGAIVAMVRVGYAQQKPHHRNPILGIFNAVAQVYVTVIRGTPMLVQLYIVYYQLSFIQYPSGTIWGVDMERAIPCVIALSLNSAAYIAEVFRAGIQAVDVGQMEAARSCGMTSAQAMRFIILPQAIKNILPAIGNEFITMVKETSIIQYLGISDLMYNNGIVITATYNPLPCYYISAILYLLLNIILGKGINIFEVRLKRNER